MLSVCSPQLGLSPESNSGGEVYDREVISRLCRRGIKIYTLLPKGRLHSKVKNLTVEFSRLGSYVPPHLFSAAALPYLVKTYKKHHFDLLRIHNLYFLSFAAAAFKAKFHRVPLVGSLLHLEDGVNHLLLKSTINKYDHLVTISQSTKREIIKCYQYPENKITVAYPGVDSRFTPHRKKGGRFTIMFVGGLKPRKNPEFLLKVMAKINRPDVKLVFAGDGPLRGRLKGKNVSVTGFIPENKKPELYHQADVVVLPSIKEGFGMTLLEAGASGLPVVASNVWSMPEIVKDGETGFLAKLNDVDDWSDKLLQLIKSPQLCNQMGESGRIIAANFTWKRNINKQIKIYENLIL